MLNAMKIKNATLALAMSAAGLLLGADAARASVPEGYFQGEFTRDEQGGKVDYNVELFIRREGERVFALQFEHHKPSGTTWGFLLAIEETDSGQFAFRKVFVDGTTPLPRVSDGPTLVGRSQIRPMRGSRREPELVMNFQGGDGFGPYTYIARRSSQRAIWSNYSSKHPFTGSGQKPYRGELGGSPDAEMFNMTLKSANEGVALPCGIAGASLELVELFDGLYAARQSKVNLTSESGDSLDQSLYGFLAPIGTTSYIEGYDEMRFLTFQSEACSSEMRPGTPASTRVVTFDNKIWF